MPSNPGDRLQHALELAYGYLNRRDRTEAQVRRRLEQHGVDAPAIEEAIETLVDQGYLDDSRFARLFAQDKRELEQWGSDRIRRTLLDRGINRELADEALRAEPSETELDRALGLLRRRFSSPPRDRRERDRALGVLLRKGYDSELALDALTAYAGDAGERELR
jgi:regulatory protein